MRTITLGFGAVALALAGTALSHAPAHPTDAQVAHIAYTANLIDIAAGKQALAKGKNNTVRAFAQEMVRDHSAVNVRALALVKKLGVTLEDNPTSASLQAAAKVQARKLGSMRGLAFDRAYIRNEIAYHETVNRALAKTVVPSAHNAQLKSFLKRVLALCSEHQKHAQRLAKTVR
jgi:putative membrane protein